MLDIVMSSEYNMASTIAKEKEREKLGGCICVTVS